MTFNLNEPPVNFVSQCDFTRVGKTITTGTHGGIFVYGQKDFDEIEARVQAYTGGATVVDWHTPQDFGSLGDYNILIDGILGADTGYRVLVRDKNNPSNVITGDNEWFVGDATAASGQSNQAKWRTDSSSPDAQVPATFTRAIYAPTYLGLGDLDGYIPTPDGDGVRRFMTDRHAETSRAVSYIDFSISAAGIKSLAGELPSPDPLSDQNYRDVVREYSSHAKSLPSTMVFTGNESDANTDTRWSTSHMMRGDWIRTFRKYKKDLFNDLSNGYVESDTPVIFIIPVGCLSQTNADDNEITESSWNEIRIANEDLCVVEDDCLSARSLATFANAVDGVHYESTTYEAMARSIANLAGFVEGGGDSGFVPPVIASIAVSGADVQLTTASPSGDTLANFGGFALWEVLQDGAALTISAITIVGQRIDLTVAGYNSALPIEVRYAYTYLNIGFTDAVNAGGGTASLRPSRIYSDQSWLLDGVTQH